VKYTEDFQFNFSNFNLQKKRHPAQATYMQQFPSINDMVGQLSH